MKIAAVQINPIIGDFAFNCSTMLSWADKAKGSGCDLVVFPEMAVSGYPPQDLLERPSFIKAHNDQAALFESQCSLPIIFGAISPCTAAAGKPLYNSAIFSDKVSRSSSHKQLLPTYDVFDESRYFEPGSQSTPIKIMDKLLGLTICEDILNDTNITGTLIEGFDEKGQGPSLPYRKNPVQSLIDQSASQLDILVNIAASPYHIGKPEAKIAFLKQLALKHQLPIVYVNQVGGQDSLIFDGQSVIIDSRGKLLAQAPRFSEAMLVYDTQANTADLYESPSATIQTTPLQDNCEDTVAGEVFEALACGTRDYMRKCGFTKAVIGLSGGIDSALTAAIAAEALGPENVLGIALPSPYTCQESIDDALQVAQNLGIGFEIIPIGDIFSTQLNTLAPIFNGLKEDLTEQNIQARIRGNLLMAVANKHGYLLLSTGNKSEMAVGYCTLYGDMSGGLAVISDVPKMLVYRICRYLNETRTVIPERTISKPPTAELAPNQKDQDDLPPYEILDEILTMYLEEKRPVASIISEGFDSETVRDVVRRVTINEHKRKQAPMGLKVTSKAFGYGRRYPTSQNFREVF